MTTFPPRWEKIRQLLRCLFDGDFDHVDFRDSLASLKTERGPAPSKRIECPDCGGEGWRRVRSIRVGCVRCGGDDSWSIGDPQRTEDAIPNKLARGWIEVDDYTEQQVSTDQAPAAQPMRSVSCDGCGGTGYSPRAEDHRCPHCEGTGRRDVPLNALSLTHGSTSSPPKTGDPVMDAAIVRDRYDFAATVSALKRLRGEDEVAYNALLISFGVFPGIVLLEDNVERAFAFLDKALPAELRVPGYAKEAERRKQLRTVRGVRPGENGVKSADRRAIKARNDEIRRLHFEERLSVHEIRDCFPLSRSLLYEILANGDEVAA